MSNSEEESNSDFDSLISFEGGNEFFENIISALSDSDNSYNSDSDASDTSSNSSSSPFLEDINDESPFIEKENIKQLVINFIKKL
jgi:hypothetical protein